MKSLYKMYLVSSRTLVYTMKKKTIKKKQKKTKKIKLFCSPHHGEQVLSKIFPRGKVCTFLHTQKRKTILKTQYASPLHKKNGVALSNLAK